MVTENTGWLKYWPALHKEMVKKGEKDEKLYHGHNFVLFEGSHPRE